MGDRRDRADRPRRRAFSAAVPRLSAPAKVEAAHNSEEKEIIAAAVNQLNAFIREIEAHRGDRISAHGADQLIDYAANIIAQLAE